MTTSASSSSSSSSSTDTALIKAKFAALLAEQKNLAESINAKILTINRITAEIATTKNDLQARKAAKGDLDSCYFELVSTLSTREGKLDGSVMIYKVVDDGYYNATGTIGDQLYA